MVKAGEMVPASVPSVIRVTTIGNMKAESVRLGKKITAVREARGWSKADLARKASVAPSYVTRIEQGKFERPSIDLVRSIADALRVTVADLTDPEPAPGLADMRLALLSKGFRPDETSLVDQILADMAGREEHQRRQLLAALSTLLGPREERPER